jgi:hypothetical protein
LLLLLVVGQGSAASPALPTDPSTVWPAAGGQGALKLRTDYLPDYGVEVLKDGVPVADVRLAPLDVQDGRLWMYAPFGNFEAFSGGRLALTSALTLRRGGRSVSLDRLYLQPAEHESLAMLQLYDGGGNHLANVTHLHLSLDQKRGRMDVRNAEVTASAELARMLDQPALAGLPIGELRLDMAVRVPLGADVSGRGLDLSGQGLSCADRPLWPQDGHPVDVALIGIGNVAPQGMNSDLLKIAPSATLKSAGEGDAPWITKFRSNADYPYEPADQHPYLVWNLYRLHDGRLEQLAASGVKHAFWSQNVRCTINCGDGNILWPGCEDVYSSWTNDDSSHQGPRNEIIPHLGSWDSCGSFFDPGCTGGQTGFAGQWLHRLLVDPAELLVDDAQYFMDAWYVVQYDIDIWNSMGYRSIEPGLDPKTAGNMARGDFLAGSPVGEWVPENTLSATAAHQVIVVESATPDAPYPGNMPLGHVRALARVEELDDGRFRYRYAIMNFDFSAGLHEFRIPLPDDAELETPWMGGPPDVLDAAWPHERSAGWVSFRAPLGQALPWFTLYNFEIVSDTQPVTTSSALLISDQEQGQVVLEARLPVPGPSFFRDRFE